MSKKFTAQVDDFVRETKTRMNVLVRESTQQVIDQAQTPVKKGGKMRVDTGFLRVSGQGSFSGMPTGPVRAESGKKYEFDENIVIAQLGNFSIGASFYFGWTAEYAKYREAYDGFLDSAIQNWPQIVTNVCAEIRRRSPNG